MRFKAIILDFDGTIVESVGIKDKAFAQLFKDYPEFIDQILEYHLSNNATIRYEKFRYIYRNILNMDYGDDIGNALGSKFSDLIYKNIVDCPYVDGAEDFLEYFYKRTPLYLASISPEDELSRILEARKLSQYFSRIYAHPWIKTDVIKNVLDTEEIKPREVLLIGDSFEDFSAANKMGISFIGRDSGKKFPEISFPFFRTLTQAKNSIIEAG